MDFLVVYGRRAVPLRRLSCAAVYGFNRLSRRGGISGSCSRGAARRCRAAGDLPSVAIFFAAFNEQEVIADKLRNTASLRYPPDKLEVLLGLDAPTDASAERARSAAMPGLRIFEFPMRRGKFEVLCDLVQQTRRISWFSPTQIRFSIPSALLT